MEEEKNTEPNKELQEWADAQMEALMEPMLITKMMKGIFRRKPKGEKRVGRTDKMPLFRCNKCFQLNYERQTTFFGTLKCAVCGRKYPDGGGSGFAFFPAHSISDWL